MDVLGINDFFADAFLKVENRKSHGCEDVIVDKVRKVCDDPISPHNEIVCTKLDLAVICIESVVQWELFFHLHHACSREDVVNQVGRQGVHATFTTQFHHSLLHAIHTRCTSPGTRWSRCP